MQISGRNPIKLVKNLIAIGEHDSQNKLKEYLDPISKNEPVIYIDREKANWRWTRGYIKNIAEAIKLVIEIRKKQQRNF